MASRRTLKAAEVIREVVASAILFEIQDPRVKTDKVTVTRVEVSGDMRYAKVYVSVMASDKNQATCIEGLQSSRGFLQAKLAKRIDTRYTPQLTFYLDQGIKHSLKIAKMLDEVLPRDNRDDNSTKNEEPQTSSPD